MQAEPLAIDLHTNYCEEHQTRLVRFLAKKMGYEYYLDSPADWAICEMSLEEIVKLENEMKAQ